MKLTGGPLITVIVPVYNSETYLNKCLESIRNQTYDNLEVILVNDGSTDRSEEICRDYEMKDRRFHLMSQQNQGSSAARNTGLKQAGGEYIGFVDSDDQINTNEKLYRRIKETAADIALCDVSSGGIPEHPDLKDEIFRDKSAIFSEYIHGRIINRVYNKLYKTQVVKDITFPVGRNMLEDASWTPRVLEKTGTLASLTEALYYYIIRTTNKD